MEDLKKIQEFFSNPVKENSRRSPDFILIEPAEIKYTESFGSGIKAPGVLHHANEGVFLGAEGAYIIVLPGGTFYVDEDKEEAIPIYPIKDQSREFQLALDYTPFSPKYETWKSWIKRPETLDEYNTGIYYKDEKTQNKKELPKKSFLSILKDIKNLALKMAKNNAKEASQFIKVEKIQDVSPMADIAKAEQSLVGLDEGLKDVISKVATFTGFGSALTGIGYLGSYLDQLELKYYQWYYGKIKEMADFEIFELLKNKYGIEEQISTWEQKMLMYAFFVFFTIFAVAIGAKLVMKAKDKFVKEEEGEDPIDTITMDVPLFIRVLEYSKEDAKTDMDLHDLAEKAISATKQQGMLSMDDYDMLVGELKQVGMEEAEEGYSQFLKTDDNPEGKTKGLTPDVMNKILMNVIKDLDEAKPGLWANIRAKKERGEKPSHGNSKAHKDAVKAGKRINKEK